MAAYIIYTSTIIQDPGDASRISTDSAIEERPQLTFLWSYEAIEIAG